MQQEKSNVVLIGMPGAGKSTVGIILAKATSKDFIDTDVLIQTDQHKSLQQILDENGYLALRIVEEDILLRLNCHNTVIATGGSAIYSQNGMRYLKSDGVVVFLHVDLPLLRQRIQDFDTRGIACKPHQSLSDLYRERVPLYRKYADIVIDCNKMTHEQVSAYICHELGFI
jgi:shikimate kinase